MINCVFIYLLSVAVGDSDRVVSECLSVDSDHWLSYHHRRLDRRSLRTDGGGRREEGERGRREEGERGRREEGERGRREEGGRRREEGGRRREEGGRREGKEGGASVFSNNWRATQA